MRLSWKVKSTNNYAAISGRVRDCASAVVKKTTFDVEAGAKQRAPVDTGLLRNSIQGDMEDDLHGVVAVGAEYGVHVEYGTRYQPAQPFLTPAMDAARPGFERGIEEILK